MLVALKPGDNTSTPADRDILRFQLCALYARSCHKCGFISIKIKTVFEEGRCLDYFLSSNLNLLLTCANRELGKRNRCTDWLRAERQWGRCSSLGKIKNCQFSIQCRPGMGSTQPPIPWVTNSMELSTTREIPSC
jgi:hypothetical protein